MLYHYTDRSSAALICQEGVIKAKPVYVFDALLGGQETKLAPAVWLTCCGDGCPTVEISLALHGWPLNEPLMFWRFCVDDEIGKDDLEAFAHRHGYDESLFQYMLLTSMVAGEDWRDWRLSRGDVTSWVQVEALEKSGWVKQSGPRQLAPPRPVDPQP
jgi:hypothetical protein